MVEAGHDVYESIYIIYNLFGILCTPRLSSGSLIIDYYSILWVGPSFAAAEVSILTLSVSKERIISAVTVNGDRQREAGAWVVRS